jgi:hypothetical protein
MLGSLIKRNKYFGIVIAVGTNNTGHIIHKIKWLPSKDFNPATSLMMGDPTWIDLKILNDWKVLVKVDLYGEEQAKLS